LKSSKISLLILILIAVAIYPLGSVVSNYIPAQGPTEITSLSLGDTVTTGTKIVDDSKIRKVPLLYHPQYILEEINDQKYTDIVNSLLTGTIKTPIVSITSGSISREGNAQGFNGPGILAVQDNKLVVNPPSTYVYGYKYPYVYGVKTSSGLQIKQGNDIINTVSYDQISNDTVPHQYVSVSSIKKWYNSASNGQKMALDYAIANFNDGRNLVAPDKIQSLFGDKVVNYMDNYPSGSPILVYMGNVTTKVAGTGSDTLGSYPEYGDAGREANAREFVQAWNGTIIPPHSTSSGKETVSFDTLPDPTAPGGGASHGVCPPARSLRAACYAAGFGLPVGLSDEYTCVMFGFNPATGVKVTNNHNYPVQITMWTVGSGTGMGLHTQITQYIPQ
jgi:hypothetical protein